MCALSHLNRFLRILSIGILTCWPPIGLIFAESLQQAIMEIIVNGHSEGQQFLYLSGANDVVLEKRVLYSFHLNKEVLQKLKGERINLKEIPEIKFEFGDSMDVLRLMIPADWFEETVLKKDQAASTRYPGAKAIHQEPFSGYLNYQFQGSFSDTHGLDSMNIPMEVGANWGQWFAFSSFAAGVDGTAFGSVKFNRYLTNLIWDDPPNFRSLTLGDFSPPIQPLMGSSNLGGISWGTKFNVDRTFRAYPDLDLETMIESFTHAELISNGQKIKEWDLSPGPVLFSDIGQYAGYDALLLLTDAYGRQRTVAIPAFTSNQLLKAGLHEYNYSFGLQRDLMQSSLNYGRPLLSGFHRYGFNNNFTAGLALASDGKKAVFSPSANLALFANHKFNLTAAVEAGDNGTHYAGLASYLFRWEQFYGYTSFNYFGRNYNSGFNFKPVSNGIDNSIPQSYQLNASLGYSDSTIGNVVFNYSGTVEERNKPRNFVSLAYQKQILSGLNISLSARTSIDNKNDYSFLLTLRYYPDSSEERLFDVASHQIQKDDNSALINELTVQKFNTRGLGLGYESVHEK